MTVGALALGPVGITLIKQWEGTKHVAYLDSVGVPTICTGSTRGVFIGQRATPGECEERLREDTGYAGAAVRRCLGEHVRLTQGQYDALVSLTFNIGGGAFCRSTLSRKLNSGDCEGAAREILRWDKAGGQRLRGLTLRRQAEFNLFMEGCHAPDPEAPVEDHRRFDAAAGVRRPAGTGPAVG